MPIEATKCSECGYIFPKWRIFFQFMWHFKCPACGIRLHFSKQSIQRCAEFAGLLVMASYVIVGTERATKWPFIVGFLLLTLVSSRVVFALIAQVEKSPQNDC